MGTTSTRLTPLAALGAALALMLVLYVWLYGGWWRTDPPTVPTRYLAWAILFAVHLTVVWLIWRRREALRARRQEVVLVVIGAVLLRMAVLAGTPPANPDLGRHLWEGLVLLEGHNPYGAAPNDQRYDYLRERLSSQGDDLYSCMWTRLGGVRSIYGPLATALFGLPHLLPLDRVLALRLLMTLLDLGAVLVLMAALRTVGLTPALAVVYAWSPVTLNAFADRGQIDAATVLLVTLALLASLRERHGWAGAAFAGAVLVKVWPLLLGLPVLRRGGWRFALTCALLLAAGIAPFAGAGLEGLEGFGEFARRWQSCDPVFSALRWLLTQSHLMARQTASELLRILLPLAALAWALWQTRRLDPADHRDLIARLASIAAAVIILSPVTYPWYTTPLLALLCFLPRAWMLALTIAPMGWYLAFLKAPAPSSWSMVAAACERWREPWRLPVYAVVALLFVRDLLAGRSRRDS